MSKEAFDKIAEALRDALAFAKGDTSKARVTHYLVGSEGAVKVDMGALPEHYTDEELALFRENMRRTSELARAAVRAAGVKADPRIMNARRQEQKKDCGR